MDIGAKKVRDERRKAKAKVASLQEADSGNVVTGRR